MELLEKVYDDKKIERLVVDSFNCFFDSLERNVVDEFSLNVRKLINSSFAYLRKDNLNVLLVLEKHENNLINFDYNIPYLVDGIINLAYLDFGIIERRIFIPKMRWTNQYKESKGYGITQNGIEVEE